MSIEHYIGAYAELKLNKTHPVSRHKLECLNGHTLEEKEIHFKLNKTYLFCPECSAGVSRVEITHYEYPRNISDILGNQKWEDELAIISPPSLFNTDTMIVISNTINAYWLQLGNFFGESAEQIKDMPTNDEVEEMKRKFIVTHPKIIEALFKSWHIQNVFIKFGYVLNVEY